MFGDYLQIRWLQLRVEGYLSVVGVRVDCVSGVVALRLNYLLVKCMPCIFNCCWNMEISGGDVCFRAKHLPKDSVD